MADKRAYDVMDFYKQEGVRDLKPMKVRGYFAKALAAEANAGHTTPEAENLLDEAIRVGTNETTN
jgi:hypothetical protein